MVEINTYTIQLLYCVSVFFNASNAINVLGSYSDVLFPYKIIAETKQLLLCYPKWPSGHIYIWTPRRSLTEF